jgi:tetratricopeptide (TPR) repeat protein
MRTTTCTLLAGVLLLSASGTALAADTEALLELGEYHMRRGDAASALNYYRKAVGQDAKNLYAHIGVQEASRQTGKDVFAAYEKEYLKDPKDPRTAYLYSRLLVPEKAFAALKAVETPDFFVHLARAKALRAMEDGRRKDEIQLASHRCPADARAQCLLARYFEVDGEVGVAKLWFEKAVKLAPKRIGALVGLGNSMRLMGDPGEALKHLRAAQGIDNTDPEVHYRVGLA